MNTKFYPPINRGGQLIFVTTLLLAVLPIFSFGQVIYETIYGESLWRNQGYGVSNHKFDIKNYLIEETYEIVLDPDPITGSCPYEFYTSDVMPLYDQEDEYNNTIKIRPYTINNYTDYTNGVSSQDLLAIANHLISNPSFESRTPTEDFPFRYISADAEYDHDVDLDDAYMIQDLLLAYRYDLERNSWEWVHKEEVEESEERFEESPYEFVIDYNWEGSEGIVLAALSTDQIQANNGNYFDFRTTKVGDIVANSSWLAPSLNSWVCGSGSYFTGGDVETRSVDHSKGRKVREGATIKVAVEIDTEKDIFALQLPISFSKEDFEIVSVEFAKDYRPKWNYNPFVNSLVILDFSKYGDALNVPKGKLVEFTLIAKHEIKNINSTLGWYTEWPIEILGRDESQLSAEVKLEIVAIIPPELYVEIRSDGSSKQVYVESPKDQHVSFQLLDCHGRVLSLEKYWMNRGENYLPIDLTWAPGMYLVIVEGSEQRRMARFFIN